MNCTNCKAELPANAKFCSQCAAKVTNVTKCPNPDCGFDDLPPDSNFCPECGWKIAASKICANLGCGYDLSDLPPGACFCPKCTTKITGESSVSSVWKKTYISHSHSHIQGLFFAKV